MGRGTQVDADRRQAGNLAACGTGIEAETAYAQSYEPERLEARFAEMDIDIYDLNRASVV